MSQKNNHKSIRMALIDDKALVTNLDLAGYKNVGIHVKHVQTFEETMRLISGGLLDVLVINLDYNKVNGIEVVRHLKNSEFKTLPIVMTSIRNQKKITAKALEAGVDLIIELPVPRTFYIEKIKSLLNETTRDNTRIRSTDADISDLKVTFKYLGESHICSVGDISHTGILLNTDLVIPEDHQLDLRIKSKNLNDTIEIKGNVVRKVNKDGEYKGLGVKFSQMNQNDDDKLRSLLSRFFQESKTQAFYL